MPARDEIASSARYSRDGKSRGRLESIKWSVNKVTHFEIYDCIGSDTLKLTRPGFRKYTRSLGRLSFSVGDHFAFVLENLENPSRKSLETRGGARARATPLDGIRSLYVTFISASISRTKFVFRREKRRKIDSGAQYFSSTQGKLV